MPGPLRAAIFQCDLAGRSAADRLAALEQAAQQADAGLLLCPELFMSGYDIADRHRECAEPADGGFARAVARIARATGTAIVYGFPERAGETVYNAALCIDRTGRTLAHHRKTVLPPGFETARFRRGAALTQFRLGGLTLGLLICYEVEFPEAVRANAAAGAQAVLVPTALTRDWPAVARRVVPARAFENGVYLLYANHAGREGGTDYLGESCAVGPTGQDIARAGPAPGVIVADIDPAEVKGAQTRLPYLSDRASLP